MSFVVTDRVKPSFQDLPLRSLRRGIRKLQGDGSDGWEEDVWKSAIETEDDDDSDDISLPTFHKLLHNRAMLQDKQSPVEELLRQADQMILTQQPRAEVYSAMAESLGAAWRDINNIMEERKVILGINLAFQGHLQVGS